MIVVHLINSLYGGGMERRFRLLVGGNDQSRVIYVKSGDYDSSNEFNKSQLYKIPMKSSYDLLFLYKTLKLIRQIKPDIIQSWSLQMNVIGGLISFITRIPHVMIEPNSPQEDVDFERYKIKQKLKQLFARYAIVVSNSIAGKSYWDRFAKKSILVRNGVTFNSPSSLNVDSLLYELSKLQYFLVVSRLNTTTLHKNLEFIFKAYNSFSLEYPDFRLVICGSGELESHYKKLASNLGVLDKLIFVGLKTNDEIRFLMKSAIGLISMSSYEGMPNVLLEAAASRCPLIISNIPAHREFISYKSANYVELFKLSSLINALKITFLKKNLVRNQSQAAFDDIKFFTVSRMRNSFSKIYRVITNGSRTKNV